MYDEKYDEVAAYWRGAATSAAIHAKVDLQTFDRTGEVKIRTDWDSELRKLMIDELTA